MADIFTTIHNFLFDLLTGLGIDKTLAQIIVAFLGAFVIANFVLLILILNIWLERKIIGRMQDRIGPNRVGPWGILQTVADLAKLVTKEIIVPSGADLIPFMLAPIVAVASVVMVWAVMPFARNAIGTDINIGVLYMVAISSLGIMSILLAGWSSNNKYALLGAFRAVAMLVSYEVPMILTLMVPVLLAGSMRMGEVVEFQRIWYIAAMPLAGLIFYISLTAEVGRSPFDLLEAESEIVAGYHIEYSGFAFAIFYAAEWAHAFTISALMAALFFGGWRGPLAEAYPTLGLIYFILKTFAIYFVSMWVRATLPRLRIDQTMAFCWTFLIPISLILLVLATLADKLAAAIIPDYLSTASTTAMLPRTLTMLGVNLLVGLIGVVWIAMQGRRERRRLEAAQRPVVVEGGAAQQAHS